jgi:hypothetical protein
MPGADEKRYVLLGRDVLRTSVRFVPGGVDRGALYKRVGSNFEDADLRDISGNWECVKAFKPIGYHWEYKSASISARGVEFTGLWDERTTGGRFKIILTPMETPRRVGNTYIFRVKKKFHFRFAPGAGTPGIKVLEVREGGNLVVISKQKSGKLIFGGTVGSTELR